MTDSIFWAAAAGIALIVAAILFAALRRAAAAPAASQFDAQVYRDQLREIERDLARGTVTTDEAQRLRAEVARRLLGADRDAGREARVVTGPATSVVLAGMALVLAMGFGTYAMVGQPGYRDLPLKKRVTMAEERRATRPDQAALEASLPPRPALEAIDPEFLTLVDRLREAVAKRPDDLQGQQLLARNEANLGNLSAAYEAQARVVALKGADATEDDLLRQATLMIQAADGQVSPQAEAILTRVLQRDKTNDTALFFTGITNMQIGRYDLAFRFWRQLLETAPPDSPWRGEVRARIEGLAEVAGVRYTLPAAAPGPSAEDVQAAENMTAEERDAMIRGMVEGLNDRLASDGGTAQEWARLITALAQLGEDARATAILAEAQRNFAARAEDLALINEAATAAGLSQ